MGAFAVFLKKNGLTVTGSDQNIYPPMSDVLKKAGIDVFAPYLAENIEKAKSTILAMDPDREGEGIAWHLTRVLNLNGGKPYQRISAAPFLQSHLAGPFPGFIGFGKESKGTIFF